MRKCDECTNDAFGSTNLCLDCAMKHIRYPVEYCEATKCPSCHRKDTPFVDGVCQACDNRFGHIKEVDMEEKSTDKLIKFLLKEVDRLSKENIATNKLVDYLQKVCYRLRK